MVRIEPIAFSHAAAIQALASDPAIGATSHVPHPYPADGARSFICQTIGRRAAGTEYVFAVLSGGETVGASGLHRVGGEPLGGELGYWIGRPYWGRGYATEAAGRVVGFGFGELGLAWIHSSCLERNLASRRVLEKLGFRQVAAGRTRDPKWDPSEGWLRFELTRQVWMERGGR